MASLRALWLAGASRTSHRGPAEQTLRAVCSHPTPPSSPGTSESAPRITLSLLHSV